MKRVSLVMAALGVTAGAMAQEIFVDPTITNVTAIGDRVISPYAPTPGAMYSNITNTNTSTFFAQGGSTAGITRALMDDITLASGGGTQLGTIVLQIVNNNTVAVSARVRFRFFDTTGASGGPGANLVAVSFNAISLAASSIITLTGNVSALNIIMPTTPFWAASFFDNNAGATGATDAQLNALGHAYDNPVDVGSSADLGFLTTAAGAPAGNPAGSLFSGGAQGPVANFGWEFNPVPEPGTIAALGLGALAVIRKRRSK